MKQSSYLPLRFPKVLPKIIKNRTRGARPSDFGGHQILGKDFQGHGGTVHRYNLFVLYDFSTNFLLRYRFILFYV